MNCPLFVVVENGSQDAPGSTIVPVFDSWVMVFSVLDASIGAVRGLPGACLACLTADRGQTGGRYALALTPSLIRVPLES